MKTKPIQHHLPLPLDADTEKLLNFYHEALHEVVCYGTNILEWSLKKYQKKDQVLNELSLVAPLLFRHIVEQLDSISIQMRSGVVSPCNIQLRVILEAFLSLAYMLEIDEKREERAACFFLADNYRKINYLKKRIKEANEFKNGQAPKSFSNFFNNEAYLKFDWQELITPLEERMNSPLYQRVNEEYLRYTKDNTKRTNGFKWYYLFGGPQSLHELAESLNMYDLHEHLYSAWSDLVHSSNLTNNTLEAGPDEFLVINQLRLPRESQTITNNTIVIAVTAYEFFVSKAMPKERRNFFIWLKQYQIAYWNPVKFTNASFQRKPKAEKY